MTVAVLSLFLALCLTGCSGEEGNFSYRENDGGESFCITAVHNNKEGDIVIPATVKNKPVTVIGSKVFAHMEDVTSITLPASIKRIGESAFSACENLKSVTIGAGVKEIGGSAFTTASRSKP